MTGERTGFDYDSKIEAPKFAVEKILIAGNRGPCAGVNMALEAANKVLSIVNGREKVWTNWPVVNNRPITEELTNRGLKNFNNDWNLVPDASIVLFSAHGVTLEHHRIAEKKNCLVIDTTCLLVTKVHDLVKTAQYEGLKIVYIGRKGHPETVGVMSEVEPGKILLVEQAKDVADLPIGTGENYIVYSQTTLMPDEVDDVEKELALRFADIEIPDKLGICYATYSRQKAVEKLIETGIDLLLVVGSPESHNSQMLKNKGERHDVKSFLIDYPWELSGAWFSGVESVGITSGASVLDRFMDPVADWIRTKSPQAIVEFQEQVKKEPQDAMYPLPKESIAAIRARYL